MARKVKDRKYKHDTDTRIFVSRVQKSKQTNKLLYIAQINRKNTEAIKAQEKWSVEFSENVLNWKHIYKLTFQFTIDTILRIFQYKYLMRILGTNKLLLQCNIVNSSLCDFCSMYVENIRHLFWECQHVQHLWSQLRTFLNDRDITYTVNFHNISVGVTDNTLVASQFNFYYYTGKILYL